VFWLPGLQKPNKVCTGADHPSAED